MKKIILLFAVLFGGILSSHADNRLIVSPVSVPQGGTATFDIELENDEAFTAFTMSLSLPDGISYVSFAEGNRFDGHNVADGEKDGLKTFGALSLNSRAITGNSGTLISVTVSADAGLTVGTELVATLSEIVLTTPGEVEYNPDDVNFTITVGEPDDGRIKFYENATTLPTYTAGEKGNVRMTRTIKAGQWSTIVLPFTLTKAKAEAAFGTDVELAEFSGFETEYSDEEDVTPDAITINFTTYTMTAKKGLTGGKPFLIKTTKDVDSFEADDVTLAGGVTDVVKSDEYETSGRFTGSFVKTTIPADGLFINDNLFWYSTGKTTAKAFRGWFMLGAVLDKDTDFGVKMVVRLPDGDAVEEVQTMERENDVIYDLSGRRVEKAGKGIYIINNKKVLVK